MARPRTGTKVTFSIPDDLLELADLQAEVMRLERYDVLRSAIAHGLASMRFSYEVARNPAAYVEDLVTLAASAGGRDVDIASAAARIEANLTSGIQQQTRRVRRRKESA